MTLTKTTAKSWFETGDTPTEAQFSDMIDATVFHPVGVGVLYASSTTSATIVSAGTVGLQILAAETTANASDLLNIPTPGTVGLQIYTVETTASAVNIVGPAAASATVSGIVELATTAETETGTDATRAVTPDGLHDMTTLAGAAWLLDEDDMASDSATKVATQQSIKAYVDAVNTGSITIGTEQATTSGTAVDFTSGLSGSKEIVVTFEDVSVTGTDDLLVQIGDSGGIETTGYDSISGLNGAGPGTSTSGFLVKVGFAGAAVTGRMVLSLVDETNNTWIAGMVADQGNTLIITGAGSKSLSAALDRVRITRSGSDTFDAGSANVVSKQ